MLKKSKQKEIKPGGMQQRRICRYARRQPDKRSAIFFMFDKTEDFSLSLQETLGLKIVTAGHHGCCDRIKMGAALITASLHTDTQYICACSSQCQAEEAGARETAN
jgi:hypothetical protein